MERVVETTTDEGRLYRVTLGAERVDVERIIFGSATPVRRGSAEWHKAALAARGS